MEVDFVILLKIFVIAFVHWITVPIALGKLADRKNLVNRSKTLWAIAIIFLTCVGPLMFLVINPYLTRGSETQTEMP